MKKLLPIILIAWLLTSQTMAQNVSETGTPAISNFSPTEYDAHVQNWSIVQDANGMMYFGNNHGLLQYDGTSWRTYPVPNVRCLALGDSGKIYAGAQGELGYFQADSIGKMVFHSLVPLLPKDQQDFADVFQIVINDNKVYFNSNNYIFIWNIQKNSWEKTLISEKGFHTIFLINGLIYVREWGKGLEVLQNDGLTLVKGGEKFANERIYVMLPFPGAPEKILMVTRTMGLYTYDGNNFLPYKTSVDTFILDNLIYTGIILSDGNILLGTLSGGAVIINKSGKEVQRFTFESGIIDNGIGYALQDRSGGIWLATQAGISRIDYTSPISYFTDKDNTTMLCLDIIRHNGTIYAATNKGVYLLDPLTSKLQLLQNNKLQSFSFVKIGKDLLVGTSDGLYKVENDRLIPVRKSVGNEYIVYRTIQSKLNPNRIFVGTQSGLWSIRRTDDGYEDEGQILKIDDRVSSILEETNGNVWVGTYSSNLFRMTFQKDTKGTISLTTPENRTF